jgi:hypothetical protein
MAMARVLLFGLFLWLSLHTQCMATRAIRQDDKGKEQGVGVDDNLNVNDDDNNSNPFISPSRSPLVDDSLLTDSPSAFDDDSTSPPSPPLVDDSLLTDSPSALDDDSTSPAPVPVPLSFVDDNMSPPTYNILESSPSPLPPSPPPVKSGSYRTSATGVIAIISIVLFLFM